MTKLPVIATMIGDPAGIGPEVSVKAIASGELDGLCIPVLIGDLGTVERAAAASGITLPVQAVGSVEDLKAGAKAIRVLDPGGIDVSACKIGVPSAAAGHAVLHWSRMATEFGRSGRIQGLIMGPRNTTSLRMAGDTSMPGTPAPGTYMFRMSGRLRVVPLTEHVRLVEAMEAVTPEKVLEVVRILHDNLVKWGLPRPRIAIAGMNPHAMFDEDRERISPAVEEARRQGIDASGPAVPDAVFRMTIEGKYDAVVTMYHDQGQIAVKTAGFEGACTVHLGLPFVRISVPHGTAFDIAGKGVAQHRSMLSAMRVAAQLASGNGMFFNKAAATASS
jgi:4-hydroxy-L-threonine phosphate dehydrogenase PdxA